MQKINDIKEIVAANLVKYRKAAHLTQAELAEKINYSDKAVSKWERGESIPDIYVLKIIADVYNIEVTDLLKEKTKIEKIKSIYHNKILVTILSILLAWLVATVLFVLFEMFLPGAWDYYLFFVYAVPVSFLLLVIFNDIWGKRINNIVLVSALMWTVTASVHVSLFHLVDRMWMIYLVGAVLQLLIIFWYMLDLKKKPKITESEKAVQKEVNLEKAKKELDKAKETKVTKTEKTNEK